MNETNPHVGSNFDDFLKDEGILEACEQTATQRVEEFAQKKSLLKSVCVHCGKEITHFSGNLWHDDSLVFPQYCPNDPKGDSKAVLHEPPPGVLHL